MSESEKENGISSGAGIDQTVEGSQEGDTNGSSLSPLEVRLAKLEKEFEGKQKDYLYLAAEFENYKKQTAKEKRELMKYAQERAVLDLLPTLDLLTLALESARQARDLESISQGLEMTLKQMVSTFESLGCEFISSVGEPFDPSKHEAMMHRESKDVEPNTVLEEFQRGCMMQGRLIRPSRVVVSKGIEN